MRAASAGRVQKMAQIVAPNLAKRSRHEQPFRAAATVAVLPASHPGDMESLQKWLGEHPAATVKAVLGKTEGNGCVNDFTRAYASQVLRDTLIRSKAAADAQDCPALVMSGGTEGVLSPHFVVFAEDGGARGRSDSSAAADSRGRLAIGKSHTREFLPEELGTVAQVEATAKAVLAACRDAGVDPAVAVSADTPGVCFVQVKCPLLTSQRIAEAVAAVTASTQAGVQAGEEGEEKKAGGAGVRRQQCRTADCYFSMALSRGASALGVASALGELPTMPSSESICADLTLSSAVASASAGVEIMHSEVVVLGNSVNSTSEMRAACGVMRDAIDLPSIVACFENAGLQTQYGQLSPAGRERLVCMLGKADTSANVRGSRTTMLTDSDLHATRHARAAVGAVMAAATGTPMLYCSGGAEHQGPPGGGPFCIIYRP